MASSSVSVLVFEKQKFTVHSFREVPAAHRAGIRGGPWSALQLTLAGPPD